MRNIILVLITVFTLYSCNQRGSTNSRTNSQDSTQKVDSINDQSLNSDKAIASIVNKADTKVKVYLENTKSMYGYLPSYGKNGVFTSFRNAVNELLRTSKTTYQEGNVELSLINNTVSKYIDAKYNLDKIDVNTLKNYHAQGNQDSDFDKLFKDVLKDWSENELIVVIADFIYSPNGRDPVTGLDNYRGEITQAFLNTSGNESPTVNILHLESDFHGNYYYDNDNKGRSIKSRPYYIFILGNENSVKEYSDLVVPHLERYDLKNQYFISSSIQQIDNYSALAYTLNSGQFQPKQSSLANPKVHTITVRNALKSSSNLQLAVSANLDGVPVSEDYLMDISNYKLNNNQVQLLDMGTINQNRVQFTNGKEELIRSNDLPSANGATHTFLLSFPSTYKGEIELSLNKRIPEWVKEITIEGHDRDIETNVLKQSQTFGFHDIVEGIYNAHAIGNLENEYFKIVLNIDQEKPSSKLDFIWKLVSVMIIIGLIAYMIIKNKQRK